MNQTANRPAGSTASRKIAFNYSADFGALAAGANSLVYPVIFDSDSVFECTTRQAVINASSQAEVNLVSGVHYNDVYCTLYNTEVGRYLTNGEVPIVNIFGTSQYPNILPASYWFMRRSVLEVVIYNRSLIDLDQVQLMFSGIKHTAQGV